MQLEHNPMQLWPKPKNLAVKGPDERHSTAPLTPLPTPTPLHALDTANVVRDVKPPNHLTLSKQTKYSWRSSSTQSVTIELDLKKAPAKTGAFPINTHNPFRKTILPVTPLDGRFYKHQNRMSLNRSILAEGYPPG